MGMPFFFQAPSFLCSKVLDGETVFVPCDENEACKKFNASIFNDDEYNSLSKEFNLYCDKRFLLGLSGSLFFIGILIKSVFFNFLFKVLPLRESFFHIWLIAMEGKKLWFFLWELEVYLFFYAGLSQAFIFLCF